MKIQMDNIIKEAVNKALLAEAEKTKQVTATEVDGSIRKIRDMLEKVNANLKAMGIDPESQRMNQLVKMYHLLAEFDPVSVKLAGDFVPDTDKAAQGMMEANDMGAVEIDVDSDKEVTDKAADIRQDYGGNIAITKSK